MYSRIVLVVTLLLLCSRVTSRTDTAKVKQIQRLLAENQQLQTTIDELIQKHSQELPEALRERRQIVEASLEIERSKERQANATAEGLAAETEAARLALQKEVETRISAEIQYNASLVALEAAEAAQRQAEAERETQLALQLTADLELRRKQVEAEQSANKARAMELEREHWDAMLRAAEANATAARAAAEAADADVAQVNHNVQNNSKFPDHISGSSTKGSIPR